MDGPERGGRRPRRERLAALVLVLATGAAYASSFQGAFVFDDERSILQSPSLHAAARGQGLLDLLDHRPVGRLSLALNYRLGGERVGGYHAVNLLVHGTAGLLLFGLLRRSARRPRAGGLGEAAATGLAFAVALLWLLHPLQTQAVTYIVQRFESMASMFVLACLYAVARSAGSRHSLPWQLGALAACWLGAGTKEVAITTPLLVLLYDRAFLADSWRQLARERGALYAALAPVPLWLVASSAGVLGQRWTDVVGFGIPELPWYAYLASQPGVILHYLRLGVWPHPLCFDYGWPVASGAGEIVGPGLMVAALLLGSALCLLRRPWIGFPGLAFFLLLAPSSSVLPLADLAVEHRMYLPLAAVLTLLVLAVRALLARLVPAGRSRRAAAAALLCLVALALGLRSFQRNRDYHDPEVLWRSAARAAPDNPRAHYNLAVELQQRGRLAGAVRRYRRTLDLEPRFLNAHTNLGVLLADRGQLEQAVSHLRQARRLAPDVATVYNNLASALMRQGQTREARGQLLRALRLDPAYADAHYNLALLLAYEGDDARARIHFEAALRADADHPGAHAGLAALHGRQREAVRPAARPR